LGYGGTSGINLYSIVVATLGAIILLAILRLLAREGRI
ncbi:MAG: GlsB/YeaQ/YmgE family stress response membrane protein, partial [Rubrobacter sp.]|nr:GlsB/YeaQ/YmgE family stress response membrane protein [Rubrobacter sp.]